MKSWAGGETRFGRILHDLGAVRDDGESEAGEDDVWRCDGSWSWSVGGLGSLKGFFGEILPWEFFFFFFFFGWIWADKGIASEGSGGCYLDMS